MPILHHKKEYGVYHWDTFDNETILITKNWETNKHSESQKFYLQVNKNLLYLRLK